MSEPKNVLIVEDSPTMRQLIVFSLRRIPNARVVEATDGIDALKKMNEQKVDLIIADINLPLLDGLKLLSMIRSNPLNDKLPIMVVTTEGAAMDREKALAMGANAFIAKPIKTGELVGAVQKLLGEN